MVQQLPQHERHAAARSSNTESVLKHLTQLYCMEPLLSYCRKLRSNNVHTFAICTTHVPTPEDPAWTKTLLPDLMSQSDNACTYQCTCLLGACSIVYGSSPELTMHECRQGDQCRTKACLPQRSTCQETLKALKACIGNFGGALRPHFASLAAI